MNFREISFGNRRQLLLGAGVSFFCATVPGRKAFAADGCDVPGFPDEGGKTYQEIYEDLYKEQIVGGNTQQATLAVVVPVALAALIIYLIMNDQTEQARQGADQIGNNNGRTDRIPVGCTTKSNVSCR